MAGGRDPQATCFRKLENYNETCLQSRLMMGFPFSSWGHLILISLEVLFQIFFQKSWEQRKGLARTPYYIYPPTEEKC